MSRQRIRLPPSAASRMRERTSRKESPAACIMLGKRLCGVKPGMVLTSWKMMRPSGVRNRSTPGKAAAAEDLIDPPGGLLYRGGLFRRDTAGIWILEVVRWYFSWKSKRSPCSSISSGTPGERRIAAKDGAADFKAGDLRLQHDMVVV